MTKALIDLLAGSWYLALTLILSVGLYSACGQPPPPLEVEVEVVSSSTKEDWINTVTDSFNAQEVKTSAGKPIRVQVIHTNSGSSQQAILEGDSTPTIWSPGDASWVDGANGVWQAQYGQPLISETCPSTVSVPTGFAMWRPMAEAMGWPDSDISWNDILDLQSDPGGWTRYDHPEWGQFKLGLTNPETSNSGRLIMAALAYALHDEIQDLTVEQIRSKQVLEAVQQLRLHNAKPPEQSARLIEQMVTEGPSELHAVNTNEAETLKSNARYGNLLPFPFVFVFPADGTIWADHPFCILDADWVTEEQREAATLFTAYLLELENQALAVEKGLRPANQAVKIGEPITLENGTDPTVTTEIVPALKSPSTDVAEAIQQLFQQTQ